MNIRIVWNDARGQQHVEEAMTENAGYAIESILTEHGIVTLIERDQ